MIWNMLWSLDVAQTNKAKQSALFEFEWLAGNQMQVCCVLFLLSANCYE